MGAVDTFVFGDQIQYMKQAWVNRNRYLVEGKDFMFTIPVKKDSIYLNINERYIADNFKREKLLNQLILRIGKHHIFKRLSNYLSI